ncbi:MAG: phosphoglycolate phosphatase [Nitrososphaeria archaeon]
MHVKAVACDIDGTMTDQNGILCPEAINGIRMLKEMGLKVIFASGRSMYEVYSLAEFCGTDKVIVAENGGVVAKSPIDIIKLGDQDLPLKAYNILSSKMDGVKVIRSFPRLTDVVLLRTFPKEVGREIIKEHGLNVKLYDSKVSYHLTKGDIDKSVGLRKAVQILGIDLEEIVSIGDSETDIPMFRACGYSVSVANAEQNVKANSSYTTLSRYGRGFEEAAAHIVDKFFKL